MTIEFRMDPAGAIVAQVQPYTMTTPACIEATVNAVRHVVRAGVEGDVVECGVWLGGSSMAMALALMEGNQIDVPQTMSAEDVERFRQAWENVRSDFPRHTAWVPVSQTIFQAPRRIWMYDTFAGMTAPAERDDGERAVRDYADNPNWLAVSLETVRLNMRRTGYPDHAVHYVRGPVEQTLQTVTPGRIAVLRLDTDFHSSTLAEMMTLYPLLEPGGVLIVDDYAHWPGSKLAVDQYLGPLAEALVPVGAYGRMLIKP